MALLIKRVQAMYSHDASQIVFVNWTCPSKDRKHLLDVRPRGIDQDIQEIFRSAVPLAVCRLMAGYLSRRSSPYPGRWLGPEPKESRHRKEGKGKMQPQHDK